jgi:hypothetical protein
MSNVSDKLLQANREKASNEPRKVFVAAWKVWCRDTAKALADETEFEEIGNYLEEMRVCREVGLALLGRDDDDDDGNDD